MAVDEDVDRFASDNLAMVKNGNSIEIEPMVSSASQPVIPQAQPADDFVTVSLDKPVPIRTPAKVMRIWVAPYQTTDGSRSLLGMYLVKSSLVAGLSETQWPLDLHHPSSNRWISQWNRRCLRRIRPPPAFNLYPINEEANHG